MQHKEATSHKHILKSTGIIGGEQIIVVLGGILRSKLIALLMGPVGVGIAGLYQSSIDLIKNGTGLGLGFSAVRDVAEASQTDDQMKISRTIFILRRWVWATGLWGMLVVLLFCRQLSKYAFGNEGHAWEFALLSVTVLFGAISSGQLALLQGLRKLVYLAKANIWGSIAGVVLAIPMFWFFRYEGIVFSLFLTAGSGLVISWIYARKIKVLNVDINFKETFRDGLGMAKLGVFMVLSTFLSSGAMYIVRLLIIRKLNLGGVGEFQAAWTISSIYLGTILTAMGADYFPRLSAVNADNHRINVLVNEQTEIAILIAGPLIIGLMSFSWILVYLLYSAKFGNSVVILDWQILGTFLKVIQWPMGFVYLAKRMTSLFLFQEVLWNGLYLFIIWVGLPAFGIEITGISFLIAYLVSSSLITFVLRSVTGFSWSSMNIRLLLIFGALTLCSFLCCKTLHGPWQYLSGVLLSGGALYISYYYLKRVISIKDILTKFRSK